MTEFTPDTPTGSELTDPLLAELRAARPEPPPEVLSSRTGPNRALVEEIIMTATSTTIEDADTPAPTPRRRPSRYRLGLLAGAAAAVTLVVGAVVVAPWSTEQNAADALVADAAAATQTALADTGRATTTVAVDGESFGPTLWEFAGDDEMYRPQSGGYENRIVDGDNYILGFDDRHPDTWYRVLCNTGTERSTPNPRTMVEALTADADFEIVGEEDIDGVRTTHLRARNPGAIPAEAFAGEVMPDTEVTAFDVWVDGDDVARRFDATIEEDYGSDVGVAEWSTQFTDLGEDITITAPAEFEDHTCPPEG